MQEKTPKPENEDTERKKKQKKTKSNIYVLDATQDGGEGKEETEKNTWGKKWLQNFQIQ